MSGLDVAGTVTIGRGKAKPFWYRHPWVFAGAITRVTGAPREGDVVEVRDDTGRFIASGFYNEGSQIRVRLVSFREAEPIGEELLRSRLAAAHELRRTLLGLPGAETDAYRLVHSEGDGLPGLIADVYGDVIVVQFSTAGMRRLMDPVLDALLEMFRPRAITERVSGFSLEKERVFGESGVRRGDLSDPKVTFRENGVLFRADVAKGQKTGAYLDQRENHARLAGLAKGKRVLDAYCHIGGFALTAAVRGGASSVLAVDSSESAVRLLAEAAELNRVTEVVTVREVDAAAVLSEAAEGADPYDMVCVDPPKFARNREEREGALRAYTELFFRAMGATRRGGVLLACCCSYHVSEDDLLFALNVAGKEADRAVQVFHVAGQAPDHPIRTPLLEGRYLKAIYCRLT